MSTEDIKDIEPTNTEEDVVEESSEEVDNNEPDITAEQLSSMDDDQFEEYMKTGKVPTPNQAKVISRPSEEEKEEKEQEETINEKVEEKEDTDKKESVEETSTIDYKSEYEKIFKPFKANGKEITPRNVEDVINLMQMGANYTKKMQTISPMRKIVDSLNKAKINEENLNFLIDVYNGDKEAIKKLLKQHNVDPMDLDIDETNYVPKKNIISDEDVEFNNALDDIQESLPKIQEIMKTKWDKSSQTKLLSDPRLMRALHEEIQMGRFDEVQSQLERERIFGRYKGMSDLDAYIDIVTNMVTNKKVQSESKQPEPKVPTKPIPDKTKAAPTRTKQTSKKSSLTAKDIFSMSEEEFNKLSINDLV